MKKKFQFSEDLIQLIVINASGFLTSAELDRLVTSFENETTNYFFSSSSESNLIRIINSQIDKATLFSDSLKYPHLIEILISVSAYSNYLTDIFVRNPEFLYLVFRDDFLQKKLSKEILEIEIGKFLNKNPSTNSFAEILKFLQRKYILKIGLRDILGIAHFHETIDEISNLAYSITSSLFEKCLLDIFKKYNIAQETERHLVLALGKLGGSELNYSSDIDLIVIFDKNSKLQNSSKEYFEILNEAIQLFTKLTSEISKAGFLYRVDFRLRPDGNFAPLARTFADTLNYYETRGELWEKQMLIKANFLTGSKALYKKFILFRNQFTFSSPFLTSPLEKIKTMKYQIEKNISNKQNVKTFSGGIRDVEFSVQALQLLNGNKKKKLRSPNTLATISQLHIFGILSKEEKDIFINSYILFRKVEHFLQLMNNSQTHEIPEDNEIRIKIASYLNFNSLTDFDKSVSENRNSVRSVFNSIFQIESSSNSLTPFKTINFSNIKRAKANFQYLQQGSGLSEQKSFDIKTIELFTKIESYLLALLSTSNTPDRILDNLVKIVSVSNFPSILYSEFLNKEFFTKVISICEFSQISIDLIKNNKSFIDLLITRKVFSKNLKNQIKSISHQQLLFTLSVQYSLQLLDENEISNLLNHYFKFWLDKIINDQNLDYNFFIAGLGSFGIEEMNFFSDLDLIVVVESISDREKMENNFQDFLKKVRATFTTIDIDFRLRPEGKSSLLVWDLKNYENYLSTRAGLWEFQTLLKINFISGNQNLFTQFESIILKSISARIPKISYNEILTMHNKSTIKPSSTGVIYFDIKKSNGGFLTIDYLIQALLIQNPELLELAIDKNQTKRFKLIIEYGIIRRDLDKIRTNYSKMKKLLFQLQNYFNTSGYLIKQVMTENNNFAKTLGYNNFKNLELEIINIFKTNYMLLVKILTKGLL